MSAKAFFPNNRPSLFFQRESGYWYVVPLGLNNIYRDTLFFVLKRAPVRESTMQNATKRYKVVGKMSAIVVYVEKKM